MGSWISRAPHSKSKFPSLPLPAGRALLGSQARGPPTPNFYLWGGAGGGRRGAGPDQRAYGSTPRAPKSTNMHTLMSIKVSTFHLDTKIAHRKV